MQKRTKHATRKHLAKLKIQTRSSDLFLNDVHEHIYGPITSGLVSSVKIKENVRIFLLAFVDI